MGLRTWTLRRVAGRLRITDDIMNYLSTFQKVGENVEVQLPGELLPVDWIWPYWLDRQLDPRSPAFVPRGHLPALTNVTHRNWTGIGNVGSPLRAIVDPRGLVTPWFDGWSLDWWIGADDRWHFPSQEAAVRQRLVDGTPVVETAMRVPGGDAVHRAYAVAADEDYAVVEIENRSPVPFAVALGVRPFNPEGLALVERVALIDRTVTVDDRPALLLPSRPARVAASTFHEGDVVRTVTSGDAPDRFPGNLRCEVGLATAAFLFPLAHTATLRVAMPLSSERRTRRSRVTVGRIERMPNQSRVLPPSTDVARSWAAQTRRGMRLELPPGPLADAVEANRRFMLLFHSGDEVTPGPYTYHRFWFRDAAALLGALDRYGFHQESAEVLRSYPARQHHDGFFFSQRQEWDANGAALYSMAEHWRMTRELAPIDLDSVVAGVTWIEKKRHTKRRRKDAALDGLMPASISAEHLGPFDYFYWDDFWSLKGLIDGAALLRAGGEHAAAAQAEQWAGAFRSDIDRSLQLTAAQLGTPVVPAGPRRQVDAAVIGSLVACWPLALLAADDPRMAATAKEIAERFCIGDAFFQAISHTGLGTYLTLQLAFVELELGDRRALDRLQWMLGAASPTFTWPEAVHPRLEGGCMGDGHHGWAAADFLSFVRAMLVRETTSREGGAGLALCSMVPDDWTGQGWEVHDAPTHFGTLSFAVRWHGERPALLWDLRRHPDLTEPVRITAPGLDPAFSTTEPKGEALLAAPAPATR